LVERRAGSGAQLAFHDERGMRGGRMPDNVCDARLRLPGHFVSEWDVV